MPRKADDFDIITSTEPVASMQTFVNATRDAGIDYSSTDHQIITAMNKSWIGTKKLNLVLQSMFWHRERPYIELPRYQSPGTEDNAPIRVQVGSKVVYTANTYDLGNEQSVFNGEIGVVCEINHNDGSIDIDLSDRVITIPPWLINVRPDGRVTEGDPRRNIDLAYVLTTHKCQGSEYQHVCYVINKSTLWAQSRRNCYTAITRARKHCTLMTDMVSLAKSTKFAG
jgi:exodeoxyribonuclease V alpha subunit